VSYAYSEDVESLGGTVIVRGTIFAETFLSDGTEDLSITSDGNKTFTTDRRTITVKLPNGSYATSLLDVEDYVKHARTATKGALSYLRATLKDQDLPIDLTDLGFTDLESITISPYI
jgi:hypothetical protein